jgi:hypothetical protein
MVNRAGFETDREAADRMHDEETRMHDEEERLTEVRRTAPPAQTSADTSAETTAVTVEPSTSEAPTRSEPER